MSFIKNYITLLLILISGSVYSQPEIFSILPNSGNPGQEMDIIIRGINTNFNESSPASLIQIGNPGEVQVLYFTVQNSLTIQAHIKINSTTVLGSKNVKVTTGTEVAVFNTTFEVEASQLGFKVAINVFPVESSSLADFDYRNRDKSTVPTLFTVNLMNDNTARPFVKVVLKVWAEKLQEANPIVVATKKNITT